MKLVAIDFETADRSADSACAIGIVSIEKGKITKKGYRLIRPPRRHFVFSYIHGISWADVEAQPNFNEVWDQFVPFWRDADYFLAHNACRDCDTIALDVRVVLLVIRAVHFRPDMLTPTAAE